MGKTLGLTVLFLVCGAAFWQFQRISMLEKDVPMHHYQTCSSTDHGAKVMDLTRYGDITIGIADDRERIQAYGEDGVTNGHLFYVTGLKKGSIRSYQVAISNFPANVAFHPRGFYLYSNSSLFILNALQQSTRIEVVNITEQENGLQASYYGSIELPRNLEGKIGDLIVNSHWEMYLAQFSQRKETQGWGKYWQFVDDVVATPDTYVHRCTYEHNKTAHCKPLSVTQSVRVTGISKDKFGSYFVAHSSIDYNYIGVYEREEKTGEFVLRHKVPVRDLAQKIEWDEGWQRTYGGALPYPYQIGSGSVPGGVIEMKSWDFRGGYVYRSIMMQSGDLLRGASCAVRQGDFFLLASYSDTKLVVCELASPSN